jgi:hypothetical protein
MPLNADEILKQMPLGSQLEYGAQVIADVIQKNEYEIKLRDIHGKHWLINQELVANLEYAAFMKDLAAVIAQSCPSDESEGSAQEMLRKFKVGDALRDLQGILATLVDIKPDPNLGISLTFKDKNENLRQIYINLIPIDQTFKEFLSQFRQTVEVTAPSISGPVLIHYFKHEFIPKMLAQMAYDNQQWGDTWMMQSQVDQEQQIRIRFDKYFDFYEQFGKKVPWLKVAGFAIIAQAREDHPEWLL